jgi:predicted ATPase/DNA-binding SARP family transcriptional activator/Flp pilus assembly protein TadD
MAILAIHLFGPFQVMIGGKEITSFATDKTRALLAYLAMEAARPHRRDVLAALFWPDLPHNYARQSLRQSLSRIRRALESPHQRRPVLLIQHEQVQFNLNPDIWLDVADFSTLIDECRSHLHRSPESCRPCLERLERAASLYRGDFLDQFFLPDSAPFEEWAMLKRDQLRQQAMIALAALGAYYGRRAEYSQAQQYVWRQIELEPWCEEAHQQLMRLLALTGRRSAALAQYESCRRILAEMLDVEPTAATTALYERIRAGVAVGLPPPCNLPQNATPFVGRQQELADIAALLTNPDTRLVTLVGPGGIGKSRLALQALLEHRGLFTHGVSFIPLETVDSARFINYALVRGLRFSLQGAQEPDQQLLNYLREKEMLLGLDNLDHLLEECQLIERILAQAPGITILATSRERLNLRQEQVYQLDGLVYPETDVAEFDEERHSAVTLFIQAARRADRRFTPDGQTLPEVMRICRLVEGAPLGIELAAGWVSSHSCAAIADTISVSDELLVTSLRNVDPRHRSLRASFEYSWGLLTDLERARFARLAVFQGSFDHQAATQVAGATGHLLSELTHKSLLRVDSDGRYALQPLLHQYAAEKLDSAAAAATFSKHSHYYAMFLQRCEAGLKSALQFPTLESIGAEIDNIRQAFRRTLAQLEEGGDIQSCLETLDAGVESLCLFYLLRDWYQEGETFFGKIVSTLERYLMDKPTNPLAQRLLGRALARQAKCCEFTQFADKALALFKRSLAILESAPIDEREIALPLNGLGYMTMLKGEYEPAEQYFAQSLARYRQAGDAWGTANVLSNLCLLLGRSGNFARAKEAGLESLAVRRALGDPRGIAASLNGLGLVECSLGDYAAAEQAFKESLLICQEMSYRVGISNALNGLCRATFYQGDRIAAERFAQESLLLYQDIGDAWGAGVVLNNLGCIALGEHAYGRARDYFLQAVRLFREYDIKASLGNALNNLGEVYYKLGKREEAQAALHEALALTQATGDTPNLIEVIMRLAELTASDGGCIARPLEWLCVVTEHPAMLDEVRGKTVALRDNLAARLAPIDAAAISQRAGGRDLVSVIEEILQPGG